MKHTFFALILLIANSQILHANFEQLVSNTNLVTYDCPPPNTFESTKIALENSQNLNIDEKMYVDVLYTHHLICLGRAQEAEQHIKPVIENLEVNKHSEIYAQATYALL